MYIKMDISPLKLNTNIITEIEKSKKYCNWIVIYREQKLKHPILALFLQKLKSIHFTSITPPA